MPGTTQSASFMSMETDRHPGFAPLPESRSGIDVAALITWVRRRILVLLLIVIAGALLGSLASRRVQRQWDAVAVVKIGAAGQAREPIEPAVRAAERLRDRAFLAELLATLGLPRDESVKDARAAVIRRTLQVNTTRAADLLELRIAGLTPDDARTSAQAVVDRLADAHRRLADLLNQQPRAELSLTEALLSQAIAERDQLVETASRKGRPAADDRFSENVLLSAIITSREDTVRTLRERKLRLQELLTQYDRFPTGVLSEIYVGTLPSRPWVLTYVLIGAGLGLFMALALALWASRTRGDVDAGGTGRPGTTR